MLQLPMAYRDQVCGTSAAAAVTHCNAIKFVLFCFNKESRHIKIKIFRPFFSICSNKNVFYDRGRAPRQSCWLQHSFECFFYIFCLMMCFISCLTLPSVNYQVFRFFSPPAFINSPSAHKRSWAELGWHKKKKKNPLSLTSSSFFIIFCSFVYM